MRRGQAGVLPQSLSSPLSPGGRGGSGVQYVFQMRHLAKMLLNLRESEASVESLQSAYATSCQDAFEFTRKRTDDDVVFAARFSSSSTSIKRTAGCYLHRCLYRVMLPEEQVRPHRENIDHQHTQHAQPTHNTTATDWQAHSSTALDR
eukprot:scaffold10582_cov73-Skeletonema_marinoi.AAC.2